MQTNNLPEPAPEVNASDPGPWWNQVAPTAQPFRPAPKPNDMPENPDDGKPDSEPQGGAA